MEFDGLSASCKQIKRGEYYGDGGQDQHSHLLTGATVVEGQRRDSYSTTVTARQSQPDSHSPTVTARQSQHDSHSTTVIARQS